MLFLRSKKRKLILNVSDLWPLAGLELGVFKKNFSYKVLKKIESFNYSRATLIMGQSEEILTHIKDVFPKKGVFLYRNFPFFEPPPIKPRTDPQTKIKLVYAGLLGVAQGIYKLCEHLDYSKIEFHIYGSGSEQVLVESFIASNPHLPVQYHGEISRSDLHNRIIYYDIAIIPLLNRIYGSVPSKIFEFARLGLPVLYFGGGEGEDLVEKHSLGWVANAGDYVDLNNVISKIDLAEIDVELRKGIKERALSDFDFNSQLDSLADRL